MKTKSDITGLWYEDEDCVFFRNILQSSYYLEWGAKLVDIFTDGSHKIVFVFTKEDHIKFREKWGTKNNNKLIDKNE
jgi:hypothetical protein